MISTIGKKLVNLQGLPYMPQNLVCFGPQTAKTVGEFLPTPYSLRAGRAAGSRLQHISV